jgi:ketosteroid isomerase-like protein
MAVKAKPGMYYERCDRNTCDPPQAGRSPPYRDTAWAMSQENVERFRRVLEAGDRRDVDAILEEFDPEVEVHPGLAASLGGETAAVYRGRERAREAIQELLDAFDETHIEVSEIRDLGDRVLAILRVHVRGSESGIEMETPYAYLARLKNGKVIWVRSYIELQDALEAAGLSE